MRPVSGINPSIKYGAGGEKVPGLCFGAAVFVDLR